MTPSCNREPEFDVTGTCDRVEKVRRNIESYITFTVCTNTASDSFR